MVTCQRQIMNGDIGRSAALAAACSVGLSLIAGTSGGPSAPLLSREVGVSTTRAAGAALDVHLGVEGVLLDEVAPRLDQVTHQAGEHVVGVVGVVDLHLQEGAGV